MKRFVVLAGWLLVLSGAFILVGEAAHGDALTQGGPLSCANAAMLRDTNPTLAAWLCPET